MIFRVAMAMFSRRSTMTVPLNSNLFRPFLVIIYVCANPIFSLKIPWETIHEDHCIVHLNSFTIPEDVILSKLYDEVLISLNSNYISHIQVPPENWGRKHDYREFKIYNPIFKVASGCIIFILFEPNYLDIIYAMSNSGYVVNTQALFIIYWSDEANKQLKDSWGPEIMVTDIRLLFIISDNSDLEDYGIFCYYCTNKIQFISGKLTLQSAQLYHDRLNNNLQGNAVSIGQIKYNLKTSCNGLRKDAIAEEDICPVVRVPIDIMEKKFNFTVQVPKAEHDYHSLFQPPHIQYDYPMLMYAGPLIRAVFFNNTKQFLLNQSQSVIIYCVDKAETEEVSLLTPLSPFGLYIWGLITGVTLGLIILARPLDIVLFWTINIRMCPIFDWNADFKDQKFSKKLISGLVFIWCFISSNLIASLYESVIASEIIVPVEDHIIQTFAELLQRGFKVVIQGDVNTIQVTNEHFSAIFDKEELLPFKGKAFKNLDWSFQILEHILNNPGKTSTLQYISEVGSSMEHLRGAKIRHQKSVECYTVKEMIEVTEDSWMFLFHMSSRFYETMGLISASGVVDEIQDLRIYYRVLARKSSIRRDFGDDTDQGSLERVAPLNLKNKSKLLAIFWIYLIFNAVSIFTLNIEIIYFRCLKKCMDCKRLIKSY